MEQSPSEQSPHEPDPSKGGPDWAALRGRIGTLDGHDRILLIASVGYVVATFLPWYEASIGPAVSVSDGAWNVGALGIMAALLGLSTATVTVLTASASGGSAGKVRRSSRSCSRLRRFSSRSCAW